MKQKDWEEAIVNLDKYEDAARTNSDNGLKDKQVDEVLAITGAAKVNLLGHSHGGQSVRYFLKSFPTKLYLSQQSVLLIKV